MFGKVKAIVRTDEVIGDNRKNDRFFVIIKGDGKPRRYDSVSYASIERLRKIIPSGRFDFWPWR